MSSATRSPVSKASSSGSPSRKSTPASSPATMGPEADSKEQKKDEVDQIQQAKTGEMEIDEEDEEDLGQKSRALTNLLKTSSVFVAIMADKMKKQQEQEAAKRVAALKKPVEPKAAAKTAERKSTRANATSDAPVVEKEQSQETAETKELPTRSRARARKSQPKKAGIADYFQKEAANIQTDGPSVQEALADAAEDYDEKPEGLGAQNLNATEQPSLVTGGQMREYQLEGLEWLKSLWMNGLCGILADEMGLGKTIQAISMIAFFKEKNISGPFLIAAPLSTVRNWIEEFKFWTPTINTILYHGSKDEREEIRRKKLKMQEQKKFEFPVVVTSYEICMNDKKFLANYQWRYIIVDEGHRLKNMNCRLIKELLTYNSANRLLITGTPLQNNIAELWSLLHFLLPEVFNDVDSFQSWFDFSEVLEEKTDSDTKSRKRKNNLVSTMHAILKPFLLRRVKTDVESTLPKKREYVLYAPLTAEQKELYREILAGTSRDYLEGKAVERIEAKSRTSSLKRKANDSGRSTPAKSTKASRASTPASVASAGSTRRGRKAARASYKDVTDREFNAKLRRLENGEVEDDEDSIGGTPSPPSSEDEDVQRATNLKLAKKEISAKKLQNPIMQARLACNSPHNFYWPWQAPDESDVDHTLITASGKLLLLDTLLPRLFELGHKVLIFSQFRTTLDILETYATGLRDWACCRIDGSISQDERYEQITAFNNDPLFKLFLLSTRAGGQGINLTAADTVILFDSDWNPQQDLQAMDRAHRIGQTKPVIVYRLATRGTVEETLLLKADGKRKLEKLVIQRGKFKSLLDGIDASKRRMAGGHEDLRSVLEGEDFEKYDLADLTVDSPPQTSRGGKKASHQDDVDRDRTTIPKVIGEKDLAILTDRTDKAYERAEKGLDLEGTAFKVAETTKAGDGVLDDLTTRKGRAGT